MSIVGDVKTVLRRTVIYKPFLTRKARRQERAFSMLRDKYYEKDSRIFGPPGYLERSKTLLRRSWKGPKLVRQSAPDVRIFVIEPPGIGGPWFESELDRSFDVEVFSITRHKLGFDRAERDLITFSAGVREDDRVLPYIATGGDWRTWRLRLQQDILTAVEAAHRQRRVDLCFAYGDHFLYEPETLNAIRSMGIPVTLLCLDDKHAFWQRPYEYPNGQKPLIGSCDVHLTNSFECVRWYMAEGAAVFYFPQGVDPELFRPSDVSKDIQVSFLGRAYGARLDFIQCLRAAGVPVSCFGLGWPGGPVDDSVDIYQRSIVNLGVGATGLSENLSCVKGRDFEVPAVGGLYLTTYDYELSRLFEIGKEIACYRNAFDCVDLIRYYLENLDEAASVGQAARQRILNQHTWTHRMSGLLQWMGILCSDSVPALSDR